MHPKDIVSNSIKKDVVYKWLCIGNNCKSTYVGDTSRSLSECVKEHSKGGAHFAIYQHCSSKGHPLPNIDHFKIIYPEVSQVAHEVKEASHI